MTWVTQERLNLFTVLKWDLSLYFFGQSKNVMEDWKDPNFMEEWREKYLEKIINQNWSKDLMKEMGDLFFLL